MFLSGAVCDFPTTSTSTYTASVAAMGSIHPEPRSQPQLRSEPLQQLDPQPRTAPGVQTVALQAIAMRGQIKTVKTLSTVTLIFIISYLPELLINMGALPPSLLRLVFFVNNVANPIIYTFLNKDFRLEARQVLRKLMPCQSHG